MRLLVQGIDFLLLRAEYLKAFNFFTETFKSKTNLFSVLGGKNSEGFLETFREVCRTVESGFKSNFRDIKIFFIQMVQ